MDRGHCAPPSGGRLIKGTGNWKFEASNLELSMILGDDAVTEDVGWFYVHRENAGTLGMEGP